MTGPGVLGSRLRNGAQVLRYYGVHIYIGMIMGRIMPPHHRCFINMFLIPACVSSSTPMLLR